MAAVFFAFSLFDVSSRFFSSFFSLNYSQGARLMIMDMMMSAMSCLEPFIPLQGDT